MIMIAGTVGSAIASEFLRAAEDIEATVNVEALAKSERKDRPALYPETLHGLNALVIGLAGYANEDTLDAVIECTLDIALLQRAKPKSAALKALPLRELATAGFEMIIEGALEKGLAEQILVHPAYKEHQARRSAEGLN